MYFYLVAFRGVIGVVEWILLHPPLAVTLGTEEGDPAPVVVSGLRNVRLRIDLGSQLLGVAIRSEDAEHWQVVLRLAPVRD